MKEKGGVEPSDGFIEAIVEGDVQKAEKLAEESRINQLYPTRLLGSSFSWAPLHVAAYHGNQRMIEMLIEKGAKIEVEDTWYGGVYYLT
jgi:DUF1365 family protein